ncbi:MAG TPA: hypothetical protein VFZ34_03930 [Blastocatellia bacterium]|nr:hypothetical protein [Blastocatellia bacterium]
MLKIMTTLVITALMSHSLSVSAQSQSAAEIKFKRKIVACGTNQNVKIKLIADETLEGRIAEIRNDSFTLQFVDTAGQVTNRDLSYSELSKVSKVGGRKATSTLKRGFLHGAGFYAGMIAVAALMFGIAAATSR